MQQSEDPRRDFLVQALGLGLLTTGVTSLWSTSVLGLGDIPEKLPPGRSIYRLSGEVKVDGRVADINTRIAANSRVTTGPASQIIFVVGSDAFVLRSNSDLQLGGSNALISGMRILSGKLLSVFGKRSASQPTHQIQTLTATIGVRGTGVYVESDPEQTYLCTCYGRTLVRANEDPSITRDIEAQHHDEPVYILPGSGADVIRPAPFINHTDTELALLEELVGRTVPFAIGSDVYEAPRKRLY